MCQRVRRVHHVLLAPARLLHCACAQPPAFKVARPGALECSKPRARHLWYPKDRRDAGAGGRFALEFPALDAVAEGGPMREDPGLRVQAEHGGRLGRQEQQQQPRAAVRARQGPGSPGHRAAPCWRMHAAGVPQSPVPGVVCAFKPNTAHYGSRLAWATQLQTSQNTGESLDSSQRFKTGKEGWPSWCSHGKP